MRRLTKNYYGPLKGEDLNNHVKQRMQIGEMVHFGPFNAHLIRGLTDLDDKLPVAVVYLEGHCLLLECVLDKIQASWWKLLMLNNQQLVYVRETDLRYFFIQKHKENFFNRWKKGKMAQMKRKLA